MMEPRNELSLAGSIRMHACACAARTLQDDAAMQRAEGHLRKALACLAPIAAIPLPWNRSEACCQELAAGEHAEKRLGLMLCQDERRKKEAEVGRLAAYAGRHSMFCDVCQPANQPASAAERTSERGLRDEQNERKRDETRPSFGLPRDATRRVALR